MNFIEALKHIKNGGRITLKEWLEGRKVKYISRCCDTSKRSYGATMLTTMLDNKFHNSHLFVDIDLMINGEWEIYEEPPKLHTFEEAIAAFKRGKTIRREAIRRFEYSAVNSSNPYFDIHDVLANDWIVVDGKE